MIPKSVWQVPFTALGYHGDVRGFVARRPCPICFCKLNLFRALESVRALKAHRVFKTDWASPTQEMPRMCIQRVFVTRLQCPLLTLHIENLLYIENIQLNPSLARHPLAL